MTIGYYNIVQQRKPWVHRGINKYLNKVFNEEGVIYVISNYVEQTQAGKHSTKQMA